MNDKFEDLLYNSGLTSQGCWDKLDEWDREAVLKFGELIVRECSKVIVNGGYRNPAFGEKHQLTPPEIAKMIREHFGVK